MNPLHRMMDANANRSREALRVMEDVARFCLDDALLMECLKRLRHGLRSALEQPAFDRVHLLTARDVEGDQGRDVKTTSELTRGGVRDIAAAAAARLTEALRAMEESAKALGADARAFERLRYESYDAEKRLLLKLPTGRARQWRLCVLITESLCSHRTWLDVAAAAIDGGADCLQLREKSLDVAELLRRAESLRRVMGGASLIINDRIDVALASGADGVHLGQTDLPVDHARAIAGERIIIGISTSNIAEARNAVQGGADCCGVGPMFHTTTKDKPALSGPAYLREFVADPITSHVPHLAIGGITPENLRALVAVGCRGIAVSSFVCSSKDPARACGELLAAMESRR